MNEPKLQCSICQAFYTKEDTRCACTPSAVALNQQPVLLTVASLKEALSKLPDGFEKALVLCGGKPAHTVTLNLTNPDEPNLDIKFYTLGVL